MNNALKTIVNYLNLNIKVVSLLFPPSLTNELETKALFNRLSELEQLNTL